MTAAASSDFAGRTCSAPAARSDRMRDIVLGHLSGRGPLRMLDLGCGTGSLARRLAEALPAAAITGIDISQANIDAATEQRRQSDQARLQFVATDYRLFHGGPFDVIVSDGVLHLIPGSTETLIRKLAADLNPGGLFVCGMPYDCAYNRVFAVVRRTLRAVRSPITDRAIFSAARWFHRRDMDDDGLRERVGYMYVPPERLMGSALEATLASAGFRAVATHATPNTSPSQLRHNVTVWAKHATAAA